MRTRFKTSRVRLPSVAGTFYPADPAELRRVAHDLVRLAADEDAAEPACAIVCPHAGWPYAGPLAGLTIASTVIPPRVILLGPNHRSHGARQAVDPRGAWRFPGFDVPVDEAFAERLMRVSPGLVADPEAHDGEHALEVLVPLLRQAQPALRIVPIAVGRLDLGSALALGEALAATIARDKDPSLLVLSSDLSHELSDAATRERDRPLLRELEAVSPAGLFDLVHDEHIAMCGAVPVTAGLAACHALGAKAAETIGYATSEDAVRGDVSGHGGRVVGYAGLRFAERFAV